jgi:hypothetical protein
MCCVWPVPKRESKGVGDKSHCLCVHRSISNSWPRIRHVITLSLGRSRGPLSFHSPPMDPNPFKPTRNTFFSRVYATPPANSTSHLPTTRPQASIPSFFGKSHTPHSIRRTSEFNASSRDDGSSTVDAEGHSIYAGHKNPQYFPQGIESEGSNVRHPYDSVEEVPHTPYSLKSEPTFSTIQAGTLRTLS